MAADPAPGGAAPILAPDGAAPVLALHCSLAHGGAWAGVSRALGREIEAPDLPGHGAAPGWAGGSLLAESVALASGHLRGPSHLVGHSFGGVTALALALERPADVLSLTLIEPVLFAAADGRPGQAAIRARFAPMEAALADGDAGFAAEDFSAVWGTGWAMLPEPQRAYIRDRIHLVGASRDDLWEDSGDLLAPGRPEGLGMPVLLLESAGAQPVVGEILDALEARLPGARRGGLPGGHMTPVTHPRETARALAAFWT